MRGISLRWRSCKVKLINTPKRKRPRKRRGKNGGRRKRDSGPRKFAVWMWRRSWRARLLTWRPTTMS